MEELEITSKKDRKHYIWVEKYRPKCLNDYLGNETVKETFSRYIKQQDIPHLLLTGGPGTGKTSLAKILTNEIKCDSFYINASDERGIDTIRDKVKSFASTSGFNPLKIMTLDEGDNLTIDGQKILRVVLEAYSLHTRFIITSNYRERIIEPIQSRCQVFEIEPPNKKEVALNLVNILKQENIKYSMEDIGIIINTYYPDIRKTIQFAQQSVIDGSIRITQSQLVQSDIKTKLVDFLKNKSPFLEIRKYINDQNINRFEEIYQYLYENLDSFAQGKEAAIILKIADGIKNDTLVVNKQIVFLACIIEMLKVLKG